MELQSAPELRNFLSTCFSETEADQDLETVKNFAASSSSGKKETVVKQLSSLLASEEALPLEDIGLASNRWFGDEGEARTWLESVLTALRSGDGAGAGDSDDVVVKDSNGAVLAEGDSVLVIKDLKVKGGSSDLKRGTLIRKIHLIGDPDNIECRVDGSTLVLKTIFLKKA